MHLHRVPLRIPTGWAVVWNTFFEGEPLIEAGVFVNAADFDEDLLRIESISFDGQRWHTDARSYIVDLGWYPTENPNGRYRLALLRGDWDHVLTTYESRDIREICDTIDRWLEVLTANWHDEDAYRRL
jgi:hypothetical protein